MKTYNQKQKELSKVKIVKVLKKTAGKNHSWVLAETKDGKQIKIRKPNKSL